MKYLLRSLAGCSLFVLVSGCAVTRSEIHLDVPSPGYTSSGGQPLVIDGVHDMRTFEVDPDEPSTPSLKKGEEYALSAEGRKQAIARKRGGFGKAMGDILLKPGQNVETITRQLLVNVFNQQGYDVVDADSAPANASHVRADIRQFWAWFTPGMWVADIDARIETSLTVTGPQGQKQLDVIGHGNNPIEFGTMENWQIAYRRAFEDYLKQLGNAVEHAGLTWHPAKSEQDDGHAVP